MHAAEGEALMIEIKMWNKDKPDVTTTTRKDEACSAGVFLSGAIQAAIDNGGTLMIEVKERRGTVAKPVAPIPTRLSLADHQMFGRGD
jgi:hypothetical protein